MTPVHAHKLVAHVAMEMAQAVYEACARDNAWYRGHRDRTAFVRALAPEMVPQARATLTDMLARNTVSEQDKAIIMDVLAADQAIPRGARGAIVH